ncbi:unnamed protein product [Diatraea saccharalis]|uniref:Uncharacterized protein n=1 Tax=Diatraea saccharalis TaxID=40085 RepID=A0A9N9WDI5_9NEOP|nr:unnamed protein product [Diatraea saccharalis]
MDATAEQLLNNLKDLTSLFSDRMSEFEKNLQQPGMRKSNKTVKSLAADFSSFKTFVWKSLGIIKSQALGVNCLDTHSRRKVLLLHGIREDKDEVVLSKIFAVLNNQMQMVGLGSDTIETCHRLGAKKKDVFRPILVRFTTMKHRMAVWNRKTSLKGSNVTLSEFLTKARQDIFVAARKHFGRKKC